MVKDWGIGTYVKLDTHDGGRLQGKVTNAIGRAILKSVGRRLMDELRYRLRALPQGS